MNTENKSCSAKQLQRIEDAFSRGDLDALRQAVDDHGVIPNGRLPHAMGSCFIYAIYRSPLAFIRTLLELGADPNAPVDDGFPSLIAALSGTREQDTARRDRAAQVIGLLLSFGAEPNQRGINDYTPLHMAVAERNPLAAQLLLENGADPGLRTRIDNCETPLEMARTAGLAGLNDTAAILERKGQPLRRRLRSGLILLLDIPGDGEPVRRQHNYLVRTRLWLNQGEPVRWQAPWGPVGAARLEDNGATLINELRIDRRSLIAGLFHGIEGMKVGGTRRLEIAPHLAYGDRGVPGVIPSAAVLTAEITILGPGTQRP